MLCSQKIKKKIINTMPLLFPNCLTVITSNDINFSILLAVISKLMFLSIFFNCTNEQSLHSARFSRFLFGYGALWLTHLFISWMRFCSHSRTNTSYTCTVLCCLSKSCCCGLVAQSCTTLCNPMDCSTSDFPVLHCLLEFAQTHVPWVNDAIQPSHHLSPLSSPALNLFQHQSLFQ